jgi:hypothetical protein
MPTLCTGALVHALHAQSPWLFGEIIMKTAAVVRLAVAALGFSVLAGCAIVPAGPPMRGPVYGYGAPVPAVVVQPAPIYIGGGYRYGGGYGYGGGWRGGWGHR